jgi:hypothetical protein
MVTSLAKQRLKSYFRLRRSFDTWCFWFFRYQSPLWVDTFPEDPPLSIQSIAFCNELIVIVLGVFIFHNTHNEREGIRSMLPA